MQPEDEMSVPSSPTISEEHVGIDEAASAEANTGQFETCVSFDLHSVLQRTCDESDNLRK